MVRIYIYIYIYIRVNVYVGKSTYIYVGMYTCINTYVYTYTYTYICIILEYGEFDPSIRALAVCGRLVCVRIYMYVYTYTYMVCTFIYIREWFENICIYIRIYMCRLACVYSGVWVWGRELRVEGCGLRVKG